MMTAQEKAAIRSLMQTPAWASVERLAAALVTQVLSERVVSDTQWDTVKAALLKEGQVEGIKRFLKELETAAQ